ncbi:MAG: cyclic nucleotide-binding domain-containing protein [Deltaproteobacteria bacterium]|nr:MAG: cyclic nucleotide-binding domain-containing protein [Deltaproteobacteria bacterium]
MSSTVGDLLRQAESSMLEKRWEDALAALGAAIEADPHPLQPRFMVAHCLEEMKETNRAFEVYRSLALHCFKTGYPLQGMVATKRAMNIQMADDLLDTMISLYSLESDKVDHEEQLLPLQQPDEGKQAPDPPEATDKLKHRVAQLASSFPRGTAPSMLPPFPLVSLLSADAAFPIADIIEVRNYKPGDYIVREGEPCTSIYMLAFGEVEVQQGSDDDAHTVALMPTGSIFGEMALISEGPRVASARAIRNSDVLELSVPDLEEAAGDLDDLTLAIAKFTRQRFLTNLLVTSPVFTPFPPEQRREILDRFTSVGVMTDEVVIKEGQQGPGLYLILGGEVEVTKHEGGSQVHLATLKEGSVFGEISLVMDTPATATVRATRGGEFLFLPREDFQQLVEQQPEVKEKLTQLSQQRLEEQRLAIAREQKLSEDGAFIF